VELLGDVGHVESHMFLFGDTVSVGARLMHDLRQMYHQLRMHPMVLLRDEAQVEACFGPFGHSANFDAR
jgi:hypothetical protein